MKIQLLSCKIFSAHFFLGYHFSLKTLAASVIAYFKNMFYTKLVSYQIF